MSIKNQLRAAILSGGATGASPSGQSVSISSKGAVTDWDTICSFVASNCGYVSIRARSSTSLGMATIESTSTYSGMSWALDGLDFGFYLPVKKGEAISIQGSALDEIRVTLVKLVGGGKNPVAQLIWRAVPCLRSTFDRCLSRTVDRIRVPLIQPLRYKEHFLRYLSRETDKCLILHQLMGHLQCSFLKGSNSIQSELVEEMFSLTSRVRLLLVGLRLKCLSKKVQRSLGLLAYESKRGTRIRLPLGDSGNQLVHNLVLGGASHA